MASKVKISIYKLMILYSKKSHFDRISTQWAFRGDISQYLVISPCENYENWLSLFFTRQKYKRRMKYVVAILALLGRSERIDPPSRQF